MSTSGVDLKKWLQVPDSYNVYNLVTVCTIQVPDSYNVWERVPLSGLSGCNTLLDRWVEQKSFESLKSIGMNFPGYFNSTLNPVIYAMTNRDFKLAFIGILKKLFCCVTSGRLLNFRFLNFHFLNFHFLNFPFLNLPSLNLYFLNFHLRSEGQWLLSFDFWTFQILNFQHSLLNFYFLNFQLLNFHFLNFHFPNFHFLNFHILNFHLRREG